MESKRARIFMSNTECSKHKWHLNILRDILTAVPNTSHWKFTLNLATGTINGLLLVMQIDSCWSNLEVLGAETDCDIRSATIPFSIECWCVLAVFLFLGKTPNGVRKPKGQNQEAHLSHTYIFQLLKFLHSQLWPYCSNKLSVSIWCLVTNCPVFVDNIYSSRSD